MNVANLSSVYDVVGGDPPFVTFVKPWKPPNKIKLFVFSDRHTHIYLLLSCACGKTQFSLFFK